MARQIERVNNLARILDINATFNRNQQDTQAWDLVLRLYDDNTHFASLYNEPTAESILNYYILDARNSGSILSNLSLARENSRALRPLISTEMWMQINVFNNEIKNTKAREIQEQRLSNFCRSVKESCQTHVGITHETLYRDEAWYVYQLGASIERADQVTRLVDVKYQSLLPVPEDVGSAIDVSQWNMLLRSAAGFHAFRRVHNRGMTPETVAGFLLFNPDFPRSLAHSINHASTVLGALCDRYNLKNRTQSRLLLASFVARISESSIQKIMQDGLHEFVDTTQRELAELTLRLSDEFFGGTDSVIDTDETPHGEALSATPADANIGQTQSRSQ